MPAPKVATPIVDKNGKSTTVHRKLEPGRPTLGRAHNIRVPQSAKNSDEAAGMVDKALALANEAIKRREAVEMKIALYKNEKGELDLNDPELIEVVRVSEVANEIRGIIERLRDKQVSERDVQRYVGSAIGGSLDGIEYSDDDDDNAHAQKKALLGYYMASFLALEGTEDTEVNGV